MTTIDNDNINEINEINEIKSWDDLDISNDLLRGIHTVGYDEPSPIQKKAIPHIINGKDVLAQAQSGTGKTATFSIAALHKVDINENNTQVLILSPTRELATQTSDTLNKLGSSMTGLRIKTMFGGNSNSEKFNGFLNKNVPHIICGCPGKVYSMLRNSTIYAKHIKLVIIDEADEMLSYGFTEQMYNIFQYFNNDIQVALFSATIPNSILPIVNKIMRDPVKICVKSEMLTLEGISQYYVAVDNDREKYVTLKDLFSFISFTQCIIYCNSVKRVIDLYEAMSEDGHSTCCIHGDMTTEERDAAFNGFKLGKSRILISSNVTSRGIDIQQVNLVVNFDVPKCVHNYLHRIGRSGRWGRKGVGINFITKRDVHKLKEIEMHYCCQIKELPENLNNI
jgi:superfamily II DNA/RNA helicase